jgi:predicted dehydrogenase
VESLRFGLFGTGYWARETDAAAIAAHPRAELVGVWGRNPEKAKSLATAFGARAYTDIDDLIEAVDAIAVALPPDVQADIAIRAAAAGRHLLLDKPLAFSLEAADRILEAVERSGVRSVVFHTSRFRPEVETWLEGIREADDWHGGAVTLLASIFEPGNPFGQSEWRREKGALWDVGPHALDMMLATLGPVDQVVAGAGRGDTIHIILHHASGASSTLTLSLTAPTAAATSAWWVYGPRGVSTMPEGPTTPVAAFGHAINALTAAGADGWTGHPSDVRHAREIVAIIEKVHESLSDRGSREVVP